MNPFGPRKGGAASEPNSIVSINVYTALVWDFRTNNSHGYWLLKRQRTLSVFEKNRRGGAHLTNAPTRLDVRTQLIELVIGARTCSDRLAHQHAS